VHGSVEPRALHAQRDRETILSRRSVAQDEEQKLMRQFC
jgi:hypothetical protein